MRLHHRSQPPARVPTALQTLIRDRAALEAGARQHSTFFSMVFQPPVVIKNSMPCALQIQITDKHGTAGEEMLINAGGTCNVYSVNTRYRSSFDLKIRAPDLCSRGSDVTLLKRNGCVTRIRLPQSDDEEAESGNDIRAIVTVSVGRACDQVSFEVVSPCWLMNKAGVALEIHTHVKLSSRQVRPEDIFACQPTAAGAPSTELPALLGQLSTHPVAVCALR